MASRKSPRASLTRLAARESGTAGCYQHLATGAPCTARPKWVVSINGTVMYLLCSRHGGTMAEQLMHRPEAYEGHVLTRLS